MQFSKTELIYQYHPNKHLSTNLSIKNTSNHNQLFKVHSGKDKSLKHQNQIVSLLNRTWGLFNLIKKSMFKFVFIKMYAYALFFRLLGVARVREFRFCMARIWKMARIVGLCFLWLGLMGLNLISIWQPWSNLNWKEWYLSSHLEILIRINKQHEINANPKTANKKEIQLVTQINHRNRDWIPNWILWTSEDLQEENNQ